MNTAIDSNAPVEWVGEGIEIAPWSRSYTIEYFDREAQSTAGQAMTDSGRNGKLHGFPS